MGTPVKVKSHSHPIILFDGVCNLCNSAVNFVIDRDKNSRFKFASLQSDEGISLLKKYGLLDESGVQSIVLLEKGKAYQKSDAALRISKKMDSAWPLFFLFIIIPRFIRDAVYNVIARNRYKWFGKLDSCRIPTPDLSHRFL